MDKYSKFQPGCELLEDPNLLRGSINKIGEPTNTFILRKTLESGGFDPQFSQLLDLDLWFRLMTLGNVVYINEKLSSFGYIIRSNLLLIQKKILFILIF